MERKLASIRLIKAIEPIMDADLIECVSVDGWKLVAKKGEFQVGDLCVYFEIDSFLPVLPVFEFLRKSCYRKMGEQEGFRLKTIKLKGQISQGLALPLAILTHFELDPTLPLEVGTDLTSVLGVDKYDPPVNITVMGNVKGNFPSFIPKTDQERIQNCFDFYQQKYRDHRFEVSLKLDGSSCTLFYVNRPENPFGICSRNYELKLDDESSFIDIAQKLKSTIEEYCQKHQRELAFQGELMGPKIQGNRERLDEATFFLFDIYDIAQGCYLSAPERMKIFKESALDLLAKHVPMIDQSFDFFGTFHDVDQALNYVDRPSIHAKIAEGCVFKSLMHPSVSFKVINNQFLLKSEV